MNRYVVFFLENLRGHIRELVSGCCAGGGEFCEQCFDEYACHMRYETQRKHMLWLLRN